MYPITLRINILTFEFNFQFKFIGERTCIENVWRDNHTRREGNSFLTIELINHVRIIITLDDYISYFKDKFLIVPISSSPADGLN